MNDVHVLSYGKLLSVLLALLALTGITVVMSGVDLGVFNVWVTLLIAGTKASLVLLFFMHFKYEGRVLKYSFLATLVSLVIIISFVFWDVAFR
ncbi:MAG: cytochrome C oxidase subunit IV family protein [Proteobacteria bacterium]|nr:cytochrome C oxidase subunit IV family protein [Pseudomonadota bacterium]